jgi:hypothetical protein
MIYYDIIVWVVKNIQSVAYDNYDDFQHVNFIFSQKFGSLFELWTCGHFVALCYYCTQFFYFVWIVLTQMLRTFVISK